MNQQSLEYPLAVLFSGKVLNGNPTPHQMMMPTLGLAQTQYDIDFSKVIVDDTNQFGFRKESFGRGHKAQAAAYTSSDWNNALNFGMVQVGGEMIPSTVCDLLPGMGSGMASSNINPYMQVYKLSETEVKCPYFIGQNQSYRPVNEQTAGHLPQFSLEESQAESDNLLIWAIQHNILLNYIRYKKSVVLLEDAQVSFKNYMHSTACKKHTCKCQQIFALVSHYDGCHDANCKICGPVRYTSITNKPHPAFEYVKSSLLRHSGNGDYGQPRCGSSEIIQPFLKRLKVENPSSASMPYKGMFYATTSLKVQPCYPKLPPLVQLPESPVSSNPEAVEAHMESLSKLIEDSTSTKEICKDIADKIPILATESFPGPSEVVFCSSKLEETDAVGKHKEEDMDFTNGTDIAVNVIDHSNNLEFNTLPSFSEGHSSGRKEGDIADNFPISATESFPGPSEVVVCSYELEETDAVGSHKEEDMDFRNRTDIADNVIDCSNNLKFNTLPSFSEGLAAGCEEGETEARANSNWAELTVENEHIAQQLNCGKEIKLETQKLRAVSLTENFTAQQIKEHISSLSQCIDQDLRKKERENRVANVELENSCQLCGADKLSFAPAPIYCSSCGGRIRRSAIYYSTLEENVIRHCLCTSCYKASRLMFTTSSGIALSKSKLVKMKNDEEAGESWVQCDKCEGWQHQICALYNDKNDMEGKSQFICPKCCLKEIQNGERIPRLVSTVFGAKDLPRSMLSDHIEQRLFRRLQREREKKARVTGKSIEEVPEAEGLVVRVLLSVDKLVKVKKQLLDILHNENYPAEFPYKSKVILLFQKIEGVDVCLFSMYVQEYGSECGQPNQRCVYISYLDSVKYFRPETETAAGEALRTVVYHEILIGYLEYCKKRGFATCYFWACPPTKGEDYILYCHPEIQKTPKSDKLRKWYQSMLQKAAKEKVVVDLTNLYDHFFVSTGQNNSKVTAARLPYFDGDYWSGAAEDVLKHIEKESSEDSDKMSKKIMSKRTLKAMGHTNPSAHATKDILLMQKLGQKILPIKEDFFIAHLQFVCTSCHRAILSGWRWFCSLCKRFQLCERCHDAEQNICKDCSHTLCNGQKHLLCRIMVDGPSDTDDKDVSMDNDLFKNRHCFLSFCQKNNYQFDTLRRAKHSSMMILHHLHNPRALTAGTKCSICYKDTPIDQCWLCEICPNVAVCAACCQRDHPSLHIHMLTQHSSAVKSVTENREVQKKEVPKTRALEALLHACQCRSPCSYPDCVLIKKLFYHAKECTVRAAGGCKHCEKMWFILILHSKNCKESDCSVPRCGDIKQHVKFSVQQPETFRRGCA